MVLEENADISKNTLQIINQLFALTIQDSLYQTTFADSTTYTTWILSALHDHVAVPQYSVA
jgi:hypothetical protein